MPGPKNAYFYGFFCTTSFPLLSMDSNDQSLQLAPNFKLTVRWSARVADFTEEWERRQALEYPGHSDEHWAEATSAALGGVEQGRSRGAEAIANIYHLTKQLPASGDLLRVEPLEIRVDQRHFVTRHLGGITNVEVIYYLGVEQYRYAVLEPSVHLTR